MEDIAVGAVVKGAMLTTRFCAFRRTWIYCIQSLGTFASMQITSRRLLYLAVIAICAYRCLKKIGRVEILCCSPFKLLCASPNVNNSHNVLANRKCGQKSTVDGAEPYIWPDHAE